MNKKIAIFRNILKILAQDWKHEKIAMKYQEDCAVGMKSKLHFTSYQKRRKK